MKNLLLIFVVLLVGCPKPTVGPQPPDGSADAASPDASGNQEAGKYTCARACVNMRTLKCPGAQATPQGHTCEEICSNLQNSPAPHWNLKCRAGAVTCATVDSCEK